MQNRCVNCGSKNIELHNFYTGKYDGVYIDVQHDQIKIVYCDDCGTDEYVDLDRTIKFLKKHIKKIKEVNDVVGQKKK